MPNVNVLPHRQQGGTCWFHGAINGQKYAWYSDNILASIGRSKVYTIKRVRKSDIFTKQNRQKLPYL